MVDYSTRSWLGIVLHLRGTVVRRVAGRVLAVAVVSAVAAYVHIVQGVSLAIPVTGHTVVGVALGLLLVLRTNASYDRYWEGRRVLGEFAAACRDLARQTASYLPAAVGGRAADLIVELFLTLRQSLRGRHEPEELPTRLTDTARLELAGLRAPLLRVTRDFSDLLADEAAHDRLAELRLRAMDENLTRAIELWTRAAAIQETPVPFAYAHHIKTFLALFCFTIPFTLLTATGWYSVAGSAAIAFGLFGIDEIGVEIEDPFGLDPNDLPLDTICERVLRDVRETTVRGPSPGPGGPGGDA